MSSYGLRSTLRKTILFKFSIQAKIECVLLSEMLLKFEFVFNYAVRLVSSHRHGPSVASNRWQRQAGLVKEDT